MLYIIATPIGNLGEITYRAVETMKSVDAILCEDTRRTAILLAHYGISRPLVSYQKFSECEKADGIVERLKGGENLALVSDAGMPLISDPGGVLVEKLVQAGCEYTVISGPCALVNAVVLSGLDASAFCMCGFLPVKKIDRVRFIERFESLTATLVFYSPPHDVRDDLAFLAERLGERKAAIVREISKVHEEVIRGTLADMPPFVEKGEFVLVVEGAQAKNKQSDVPLADSVDAYIAEGMRKMDAVKRVAAERGMAKSDVYAEYERGGNKKGTEKEQ